MYSQPFKHNVLEEINKILEKNLSLQTQKHDRKKIWKNQTLVESLYNGKNRLPSVKDIDQGGNDLKYDEKKYCIGNCYLLSALMGLAHQRPEFIKNTLIKEKNENEVEVTIHGIKINNSEKQSNSVAFTQTFEPNGKTYTYSVTKDEALKWKTTHKALWPVVVEIAFAKYLNDLEIENLTENSELASKEILEMIERDLKEITDADKIKKIKEDYDELKEAIYKNKLKTLLIKKFKQELENNINALRKLFMGYLHSKALTHLTGAKTVDKVFDIKDYKNFAKFKTSNYNPEVIQEYHYLKNQFNSDKVISVSLFHGRKNYSEALCKSIIDITKNIKFKNKNKIKKLFESLNIEPEKYLKWLKTHGIDNLDNLSGSNPSFIIESIIQNLPDDTINYISKTKHGIVQNHCYTVTNLFEYGGYKYITLRNPHQTRSKVFYDKSSKLTSQIDLPKDILNSLDENEFIIELNHFWKYLDLISYEL